MPKITRKTQKIFCGNADNDQLAVFGSMATGSPVYTNDVEQLQSNTAYSEGWQAATLEDKAPFMEEMNGLQYSSSYQLAYILQQGIAEWDAETTYYTNSYVVASDGNIYKSNTDNNIGNNPISDSANWFNIALYGANVDLSNLSSIGADKLNTSKMYLTGSISTDEQGYNQLEDMYHSSFDLSKFTVVGNPTITDDGIASGFGSSNYLNIGEISLGSTFEIDCLYLSPVTFSGTSYFWGMKNSAQKIGFARTGNYLELLVGDGTSWVFNKQGLYNFSANTLYYLKVVFDGTKYVAKASTDNDNWTTVITQDSSQIVPDGEFIIGVSRTIAYPLTGSIDLKQFSITVDGVPVFNGNKTGLDVIKPDDYTVVGSPTISADGVASGFSSSNYLRGVNIDCTTLNKLELNCSFTTGSSVSTNYTNLWNIDNSNGFFFGYFNSRLGLQYKGSGCGDFSISPNTSYDTKVIWEKGVGIRIYYKISSSEEYTATTLNTVINGLTVNTNGLIQLGYGSYLQPFNGSLDLNAFKIYIDGDLVYQPCLKVPYTESKTGSKIVDAVYRDRVQDVYNQFGTEYLYYTIDEENKNFTLPMGEIYGMIENAKADLTSVLNKTQITNCLLEVPQNIKLELNNGVLTLKAGSKVIVPNGANVFNEVTISSDKTRTWTYTKQGMMFYRYDTNVLTPVPLNSIYSGTTAPAGTLSSPTCWYDTTNNKVKITSDGGTTWIDTYSFPLCLLTANGTQITSIDQVFNGFGFIGHHTFSYEGIKSLIPNGKNPDGTLKNIETITTAINVRDEAGRGSLLCFWDGTNILSYGVNNYFEQDVEPVFNGQHGMWLNTKENVMYSTSDYGATWTSTSKMYLGRLKKTTASGDFVEASFKTPVELVKMDDLDRVDNRVTALSNNVTSMVMPDYSSGESKTLATTYTASTDGYLTFTNINSHDDLWYTLTITYNSITKTFKFGGYSSSTDHQFELICMPIPKGATYKIEENYHTSSNYEMTFFPVKGVN